MWAFLGKFFGKIGAAVGVFLLNYFWGKLSAYISEKKKRREERAAEQSKIQKQVDNLKKAESKEAIDAAADDFLDDF